MKEEMGKFFCLKCNRPVRIYLSGLDDITLFRTREKNGIKKWIFKRTNGYWSGDFVNQYKNIKDCWEETGGFSEKEIESIGAGKAPSQCKSCKSVINNFKSFLYQVEIINPEENNYLKMLEKDLQEEKIKTQMLEKENNILSEKINSIMSELKEIKSAVLEIKDKTNTPK